MNYSLKIAMAIAGVLQMAVIVYTDPLNRTCTQQLRRMDKCVARALVVPDRNLKLFTTEDELDNYYCK